jgi:hypothetical protein
MVHSLLRVVRRILPSSRQTQETMQLDKKNKEFLACYRNKGLRAFCPGITESFSCISSIPEPGLEELWTDVPSIDW